MPLPRHTHIASFALALCLGGVLALPAGCTVKFASTDSAGAGGAGSLNDWDAGSADEVTPSGGVDAGAGGDVGAVPGFEGSPLCNASSSTGCFPDDPANAQSCNLAVDAGADDGGGATSGDAGSPYACHVSPSFNAQVGQVCVAAGAGRDGDACTRGADCAAGFECIGEGTCRHYCCEPTACDGTRSFCDIQTILNAPVPDTKVPVCMPIRPCTLLSADYCQADETCAVVEPASGVTSCVPVGPQTVGQECETNHCADDLVCLGPVGARVCYQLCHTDATSQCPSGQTCVGSAPEFQDPSVGICQ